MWTMSSHLLQRESCPVYAWGCSPVVLHAPHSSEASSIPSSTSTKPAKKRNVNQSELCFITNDSSYVHQRAHWINSIQGKEEKDKDRESNAVYLLLFMVDLFCHCAGSISVFTRYCQSYVHVRSLQQYYQP